MTPLTHISGYAHVAERYGFEEAVFLDAIMFWYRTNRGDDRNFHDGRWWTYNSVKAFESVFPWWTGAQIRRIIARCREKGAMLAGNYNQDQRDRTAWYTPSDELLGLYGESVNCICQNEQMQKSDTSSTFDENSKCNIRKPCSNHVETNNTPCSPPAGDNGVEDRPKEKKRSQRRKASVPTHAPERFEHFWAFYPGGGSRLKAVAAWDALAPSDELIDEMGRALKRQMATRLWQEGVGIPHASNWLNQRRWTDKLPNPPHPQDTSGGWADDPEVSTDG